jgi:hypothetical protein
MIVGDCRVFAIESGITEAWESLSQLALGYFVVHVGGRAFGVRQADASTLGCSFNEVGHRLRRRGTHVLPIALDVPAPLRSRQHTSMHSIAIMHERITSDFRSTSSSMLYNRVGRYGLQMGTRLLMMEATFCSSTWIAECVLSHS